jgi:hypothetical protein
MQESRDWLALSPLPRLVISLLQFHQRLRPTLSGCLRNRSLFIFANPKTWVRNRLQLSVSRNYWQFRPLQIRHSVLGQF